MISVSGCFSNPGFSKCSFMALNKVHDNFSCIKIALRICPPSEQCVPLKKRHTTLPLFIGPF